MLRWTLPLLIALAGCADEDTRELPLCADLGCPDDEPRFCRLDGICTCPTDAGVQDCLPGE